MNSISQAFETSKTRSVRIYRWVTAWLFISAVIALLLLANSIRDYRFVSRFIATAQVRHQMSQRATALEHQLRQNPLTPGAAVNALMEAGGNPVWIELRGPDGKVLEHAGGPAQRLFSHEDEISHSRNHEPLFTVVATSVGDVVVEVFAIHAPATPMAANPPAQSGPPAPLMLEIAMPLSGVDRSVFWPIRRNLFINCSGALALLVTVVVAGLGFRSYAHGKYLEEQLEIARQVQSELLPPLTEKYVGVDLATEYTPAEQVGGDFYDVFRLKDQGTALVMGDVSGKGRARSAPDGRDPRRRPLRFVVRIALPARVRIAAAESPPVRTRFRRALCQHVLVLPRFRRSFPQLCKCGTPRTASDAQKRKQRKQG
jgi:hypothetical protein